MQFPLIDKVILSVFEFEVNAVKAFIATQVGREEGNLYLKNLQALCDYL